MNEDLPPSYESTIVCVPPSAPRENPAVVPDEDSAATLKQATSPIPDTSSVPSPSSPNARTLSISFPPLKDTDMKRACSNYAGERCCYGFGFVDGMRTTEVTDRIAFHYTLESYGEKRETAESIAPNYHSQVVGPGSGVPPDPWDIPVTPRNDFTDHRITVEIPHTAFVKVCPKCQGKKTTRCNWCMGIGGEGCLLCIFSEKNRPCSSCKFSSRRCMFCSGRGQLKCKKCDGQGRLRSCKLLIVTWINHLQQFVSDTLKLPVEEILEAKGKVLLSEEAKELSPICHASDASVNAASASLIQKHSVPFRNELIVKQRHTLRAVPFTQIKYQWNDKSDEFYVCGLQMKAYFDNYPQQCCCAIM